MKKYLLNKLTIMKAYLSSKLAAVKASSLNKLAVMKKYLSNKLNQFFLYIAGNDEGLKRELEEKGAAGVFMIAVVISAGCYLTLKLWAIL